MKTLGLNLRQLQVFVKVVELGSVSRAAEALGSSQPQVSRTVADIERKLDTKVFFRTPEGLELTPTGRVLYRFAQQTLSLLYETEVSLDEQVDVPACPLFVGVNAAVMSYAMAGARAFHEEYPTLPIHVEVASGHALFEMVQRQQVALGLVVGSSLLFPRDVQNFFLGEQEWALLVPEGQQERPLEELDLILPPEESWEWLVLEERIPLPQPRIQVSARDVRAACALAQEGFAAYLPLHCSRVGLVPHAQQPRFSLEVHAVRPPGGRYPVSARAYMRLLSGLDLSRY
ncbi:LysR family transcriptional regulator [Oceanithermus sp.]